MVVRYVAPGPVHLFPLDLVAARARWMAPLPDGQISQFAVKPDLRKYSSCPVGQITTSNSPVSPHKRGVS